MAHAPARRRHWGGLVWTLIRTDFKARYHGTLGGFVWALLKPAAMFIVLMTVFSLVFPDNATYKLDLLIGLFLYDFFAETTKTGITALHARGYLLTKARFPSWILVVTALSNPLLTVSVFCVAVLTFLVMTGTPPAFASVLALLAYVAAMGLIAVGIALGGSVLFLRYRDLNQVWDVITQAGFFVAPVIYPIGVIPERFHFYLYLWPPTAVIEFARAAIVDRRLPSLAGHADLGLLTLAILAGGAAVYRWLAPRAAEYL
ncbi:MAG: ABC transporter permease [Vicinamibacterales bacterium]